MSNESIRATVFDYFSANFLDAETEYENLEAIDPSTRTLPYVKLTLRFGLNEQISFNPAPRTRQHGAVQADVYIKKGTGTKAGYVLSDSIQNLFIRKSISGIEFATPSALTPLEVAGWWRLTIRAPFYFDS